MAMEGLKKNDNEATVLCIKHTSEAIEHLMMDAQSPDLGHSSLRWQ
jgi:hypothetical protein